jgi:hypothetical protein
MAILTADDYRTLTGLTAAQAPDVRYAALCDAASKAVETYCKRAFEKAAYVEYHAGDGTRTVKLRRRPVLSVTSVYYDRNGNFATTTGSFDATTLLTAGVDYAVDPSRDSGLLYRLNGVWPELIRRPDWEYLARERSANFGEIKVTYVGGYDPVPADVKLACAMLVTNASQQIQYGGQLEREHLGDWSYKLADRVAGMPPELSAARTLLNKYRESPW